jgi:hypothetical protein
MSPAPYFTPSIILSEPWQYIYAGLFIIIAAFCTITLLKHRAYQREYRADLAWLRAIIYLCATSIIALLCGVTDAIVERPLATQEQISGSLWLTGMLLCSLLIIIAYGFIWAKGTYTDGRQWHPFSTSLFGLMWGISQAQLFLSFWALTELAQLSLLWTTLITIVLISIYNGNWQQFYWDIKVSPPHNYPEWNVRKVLLCHVPNLLLTLPFFAIYGNVQLYIFFQTGALLLSSHRMHFPHWADNYRGHAVKF